MECPDCKSRLSGAGTLYHCPECNEKYTVDFYCEVCGAKPDEVSSCGSVGFFCPQCNSLKSRTAMKKDIRLRAE